MDKIQQAAQRQPSVITRLPQLNAVILEADRIKEDAGDVDTLARRLQELDKVVYQMINVFHYGSRFEEKTEDFLTESQIIENNFDLVQNGVDIVMDYIDTGDASLLNEGIQTCVQAVANLFDSFDRLKDKEKKREIFSRSAYLNEVIRVANGVIKGALPIEALEERLNLMIETQEHFYDNLDKAPPSPKERKVFEENRDKMEKAAKDMLDGLYQAKKYLEDQDPAHIEEGLEKSNRAADVLLDIQEEFKKAMEAPQMKPCLKCSAENPWNANYCVKCNFNFPPLQTVQESTIDLKVDEAGGVRQTGHVMTENVLKVSNAVDDIRRNRIEMPEFLAVVEWFEVMAQDTLQEAEKIQEPEEWDNEEMQEAFEVFKDTFYNGMADMEEGIEKLRAYSITPNPILLDEGLEKILTGGDQLYQVQMTADKIRSRIEE